MRKRINGALQVWGPISVMLFSFQIMVYTKLSTTLDYGTTHVFLYLRQHYEQASQCFIELNGQYTLVLLI